MTEQHFWMLISLVGLIAQIGVAVLLWLFFMLLKRHAGRRSRFFRFWTLAWACLLGGLAFFLAEILSMSPLLQHGPLSAPLQPVFMLLYQLGKLLFLMLLLCGTLEYANGKLPKDFLRYAVLAVLGGVLLSTLLLGKLTNVLMLQAVASTLLPIYAGARLFSLPRVRRSLGTRVTGGAFMLYVLLWTLYGLAIYRMEHPMPVAGPLVDLASHFYGYLDGMLQLFMAFGMVLMLLEEARRDANAAHAELAVAHEKLLHESLTDTMTGVYNRMAFTNGVFLQTAGSTFGSVFLFDLDNLKLVNDSHGHEVGDELIKYFVLTLRGGLRPADQLYRWGGDEFLLLLPGATYATVSHRLDQLLHKAPPLSIFDGKVLLKLEVSVGGADYADLEGLRQAVNSADRAMY